MNIYQATSQYEQWFATYTPLIQADLDTKHQQMSVDVFSFLRATYYRWTQEWPETCKDLMDAPIVLAVGDLHLANFGTWRDRDGRLCWGINDFDVASPLPYTHDLTRLATSALLAIQANSIRLKPEDACAAILSGYVEGMQNGGKAYVLAEQHGWLRDIATASLKKPQAFWQKMDGLPNILEPLPESARAALEHALPAPGIAYQVKHRTAGLGSLGLPRYVAIAEFEDGRVAREAKAMVPAPTAWATNTQTPVEYFYEAVVDKAVRAHDPFTQVQGHWIMRRLAPDCIRVELTTLPDTDNEAKTAECDGQRNGKRALGQQTGHPCHRAGFGKEGAGLAFTGRICNDGYCSTRLAGVEKRRSLMLMSRAALQQIPDDQNAKRHNHRRVTQYNGSRRRVLSLSNLLLNGDETPGCQHDREQPNDSEQYPDVGSVNDAARRWCQGIGREQIAQLGNHHPKAHYSDTRSQPGQISTLIGKVVAYTFIILKMFHARLRLHL